MKSRVVRGLSVVAFAISAACSGPSADEHLAKGNDYFERSLLKEAIVEYRAAVQADGMRGDLRLKLAEAYAKNGDLAGAGIDVFEREPPEPDNPLFQMENVLLAPHAVCWTDECFQTIGETAVRSLLSVARGERPSGMINPEVWDRPGFQRKLAAMQSRTSA